eukprot:10605-Heterococcus_DN1.PRE.4
MKAAAGQGHAAMCQFLHSQQCTWDEDSTSTAATNGHIDVLRWLIDNGCPWDAQHLCQAAAEGGSVAVLTYLQQLGMLSSAARLTNMFDNAVYYDILHAAKWLRQQGAEWPTVFLHGRWSSEVLEWARSEGFTR